MQKKHESYLLTLGINIEGREKKMAEELKTYSLKQQKRKYDHNPNHIRKRRSDRKIDIQIPIPEDIHSRIIYLSERRGVYMETIATEIVKNILMRVHDFPPVDYVLTNHKVTIKADEDLRWDIALKQSQWGIKSKRKVVHRIFMYAWERGNFGW